jgi:phytanoyl-CoA hydroxylase
LQEEAMQDRFSGQELAHFASEGFVVVRDMVESAVRERILAVARAHLAHETAPVEYEAQLHYPGAPESLDAPGGHTVRRLLQACARDPVFLRWGTGAPVAARLRQLLGEQVRLAQAHHNCVMTKQPRYSSVTGWHQDIRYWAYQRPELISVWLALGRETPENGGLSFIPGSHRMEFARERLDDALFLREDLPENQALIARRQTPTLEAGDVVFFHCRTFHAAGANRADATKFSLVFTYHAADNAPLPGTRSDTLPAIAL